MKKTNPGDSMVLASNNNEPQANTMVYKAKHMMNDNQRMEQDGNVIIILINLSNYIKPQGRKKLRMVNYLLLMLIGN